MYRPPRRADDNRAAGWGTYLRFQRTYLYPHRWSVLLCLFLVSANACSVYLMSFYGKVVVDKILCVRSATAGAPAAPAGGSRSSSPTSRSSRAR